MAAAIAKVKKQQSIQRLEMALLMLTWKTNTPQFSMNGDDGNTLLLYFGETCVDDFNPPECVVHIRFFELNNSWSAKAKSYPTHPNNAAPPEVDLLVSELTSALQARLDFEFSKYLSKWKEADPHFMVIVLDSSKHTWLE